MPEQRPDAAPCALPVLVAEDNPVSQRVVTAMLRHLGLRVDVVDNGRAAVEALGRLAYAAVLMDCQMPVMSGFEATAEIRRREAGGSRTPIVALTASTLDGDRQRCLAAGMDGYLAKPMRIDDLEEVLRRVALRPGDMPVALDGSTRGTPAAADRVDDRVDEEILAELGRLTGDPLSGIPPLVELFLAETSRRIERIGAALAASDLDEAAQAAHSLKGSAGAFGARRLSALGAALEARCRAPHPDGAAIVALVPVLQAELDAFRALLVTRFAAPVAVLAIFPPGR